jgi:hypothetical protein
MEVDAVTTLVSLLAIPAAAGAAYGGVRAGLNGCRRSLESIERIVSRLDERVDTHGDRITVLEVETSHLKNKE